MIIIQIFKNFRQICNGVADLSKIRLGVPPKKRAYVGMHILQEGIMPGKGKNRKLTKYLVCFYELLKPSRLDHYVAEVNLETQIHNCL